MTKVKNLLARKPLTTVYVSPETTVIDALRLMSEKNIGSVLVLDKGEYQGIMSERDYSRKVILKGKNSSDTKVGEIMQKDLPELDPEDSIDHCMHVMTDKNLRYLPVFEGRKLVGIVSMSDVVKSTIASQKETINHLHSYINSR